MTVTWLQRPSHWAIMRKAMSRPRRLYTMATLRRTSGRAWRDRSSRAGRRSRFLAAALAAAAAAGGARHHRLLRLGSTGHNDCRPHRAQHPAGRRPLLHQLDRAQDGQAHHRRHPAQGPPRRHLHRVHRVAVVGIHGHGHLRQHHHHRLWRTRRARSHPEPPAGASALHAAGAFRRHPAAGPGPRADRTSTACSASTARPGSTMPSPSIYWPIAVLLALVILTTPLPPVRTAPTTMALGAAGRRLRHAHLVAGQLGRCATYIAFVFSRTIAYGTLAAPVAVLLFLYVTALAVLLGAELNATLDLSREDARATRKHQEAASRGELTSRPVRFDKRAAGADPRPIPRAQSRPARLVDPDLGADRRLPGAPDPVDRGVAHARAAVARRIARDSMRPMHGDSAVEVLRTPQVTERPRVVAVDLPEDRELAGRGHRDVGLRRRTGRAGRCRSRC